MRDEKVLVIDDEPDICELLSITLKRMDLDCDVANTYQKGIELIEDKEYFLVLTDMKLPDGTGYDIVSYIQKNKPKLPVAVITAFGNVEGAVNTLKAGAFDYVSKPVKLPVIKSLVNTAFCLYQRPEQDDEMLIGQSAAIQQLRDRIYKLARSQAPVFIYGESGVGKELVARLIHAHGPRSDKPFVAVNCGAIPSELMESEFFGHKKGSFTGAYTDKQGLFEAAEGSTLFLDEVADLPLAMQVKLFRVIQEKAVKPIGSTVEIPVDVRILSASNKNLLDEIAAGRFRQELYYRINVIELGVPTLKEHIEDVDLLAANILNRLIKDNDREQVHISPDALDALMHYSFPGNVRELENILERALTLCSDSVINVRDLQLRKESLQLNPASHENNLSLDQTLNEKEKALILQALEQTKWNRTAAAKLLNISFRTLRYRLKKHGLD